LPPLPTFKIQIKDTNTKLDQIISNVVQGEIMFHLSDPTHGIQAIKFIHVHFGKTKFLVRRVRMKWHGMGAINAFWIISLFRGARPPRWIHSFMDIDNKGFRVIVHVCKDGFLLAWMEELRAIILALSC
jgi:hypothetical protein